MDQHRQAQYVSGSSKKTNEAYIIDSTVRQLNL